MKNDRESSDQENNGIAIMKRVITPAARIRTMLFLFVVFGFSDAVAEETVCLTNGEWPPYYGKQVLHYGFDSHIVTEAFARVGVTVTYEFYPWVRACRIAKTDRCDGGVGGGSGLEYQKNFYVSEPTSRYEMVFFHRKSCSFDWKSYDDLKRVNIGLTRGYDYPDQLLEMAGAGEINVQWVSLDKLNFRKLLKGRIDIFPNDKRVGVLQVKKLFTPEEAALITYHQRPFYQDTLHLILSRKKEKNEQLIKLFNKGMRRLKQSGRYDEIMTDVKKGKYR